MSSMSEPGAWPELWNWYEGRPKCLIQFCILVVLYLHLVVERFSDRRCRAAGRRL